MIKFTWDYIREQFEASIETGHEIITVKDYFISKNDYFGNNPLPEKFHINRIDVDFSIEKAERIATMFNDLKIKGTFFVRLHEYNLLTHKNYRILQYIKDSGHEIGLHSESVSFSESCGGDSCYTFLCDVRILEYIIGDYINSCADHQDNRISCINQKPETYLNDADKIPDDIITITDSDWTKWKTYLFGKKWAPMDIATAAKRYDRIYTLIHPCTYYEKHVFDD